MDIFMSSSEPMSNATYVPQKNYAIPLLMLPYISIPNQPFSDFCLSSLDQGITFDIELHNRKLCFYGQSSYSYNGVRHTPKPLPAPDNYLHQILLHLKQVLPDFQYNSVLITKYDNG